VPPWLVTLLHSPFLSLLVGLLWWLFNLNGLVFLSQEIGIILPAPFDKVTPTAPIDWLIGSLLILGPFVALGKHWQIRGLDKEIAIAQEHLNELKKHKPPPRHSTKGNPVAVTDPSEAAYTAVYTRLMQNLEKLQKNKAKLL